MQPFGPTLKELRLEKNYTLKDTADRIVSVQFRSNFEKGVSDIKLTNFVLLLNRIHVTFEEFLYRYEDRSVVDFSKISRDFAAVTGTINDRYRLQNLAAHYHDMYLEYGSDAYEFIAVLCEEVGSGKRDIPEERKQIVRDFLMNSEYWTKFEFFLFELLPEFFTGDELINMLERVAFDARRFPKYYEVIEPEVYLNVIFILLKRGEIEQAEKYLQGFYQSAPEPNLDHLNHYALASYLSGLILLSRGEEELGTAKCLEYIRFIDLYPEFDQTKTSS